MKTNRSIQAEGAFGVLKQDHHFRRFICAGKKKVASELYLLGRGYNIRKHYRKTMDDRLSAHLLVTKKSPKTPILKKIGQTLASFVAKSPVGLALPCPDYALRQNTYADSPPILK